MGNTHTKEHNLDFLESDEVAFVENSFKHLTTDNLHLNAEGLEAWSKYVDPAFVKHVSNSFFRKSDVINVHSYGKHFYIVVKGNVSEKAEYIAFKVLESDQGATATVQTADILKFASAVIRSYFIMLTEVSPTNYRSWTDKGVRIDKNDIKAYSHYAIKEVEHTQKVSISQLERWLYRQPLFMQLWREVMIYLYSHKGTIPQPDSKFPKILPFCEIPGRYGPLNSFLTIPKVLFICDALPMQFRRVWTPLFNSKIHGESFTTLITKIVHRGPTIILVKDEGEFIFGGFASASWTVSPIFSGELTAVLFTVQPKMDRFITSGHNDHFQYLNTGQQTMPNGLGMGGQFNYWGLWLDGSFQTGHSSETCSTFIDYSQMSANKFFHVRQVEVWSVNDPRKSMGAIDDIHATILSDRKADKFLLELAGHEFRSDGIRQSRASTRRSTTGRI